MQTLMDKLDLKAVFRYEDAYRWLDLTCNLSPEGLSYTLVACRERVCASLPSAWIEKLAPEIVLLSVAAGDLDGFPSPETVAAVDGYSLLRTDRNGWIELSTDGEQMWVEVEWM